jgi:hypothetical protein
VDKRLRQVTVLLIKEVLEGLVLDSAVYEVDDGRYKLLA